MDDTGDVLHNVRRGDLSLDVGLVGKDWPQGLSMHNANIFTCLWTPNYLIMFEKKQQKCTITLYFILDIG